MAPTPFGDKSTSRQNCFLKSSHTSIGASTSVLSKPQMLVDNPNSTQNQHSFFSIKTTKQPIVNNPKHNSGNTQLGPRKT